MINYLQDPALKYVPYAAIAGPVLTRYFSNMYSQAKQREFYNYQKKGYERQLEDWHKNVPGREIRYPELSYPGRIRAADTGISQSYASSYSTTANAVSSIGSLGFSAARSVARSLYGGSTGRTSRYL